MIGLDLKFKDQVAIVTGSSSGIGKACAIHLAELGAKVVVNYSSNLEEGEKTLNEILSKGGTGILVKADVSHEEEVKALFNETISKFGRIDIVISNAGLQKDSSFLEMTLEQWQKVIDVNLTGQFLVCREAARQFVAQEKAATEVNHSELSIGKIILMSSVHDVIPWAGHVNYAASKGGIMMFMKSISQELAPYKIRVNSVSPGAIKTSINKEVWSDPDKYKGLLQLIPYKRIGTPQDVAKAVAWLASDDSDYVNGETLYIDGGMTLYPEFADNG
ncbi:SDR family oxidoreductase [Dyadobacter fanqingshengii]|uniref:SDR family oxidoreductase n=1 Tax=Dyadobacter fanqingshengii TaxID=2906443 RepID=A0A9X1T9N5_9BACT|nr:SDR family oxidoreductase [Dyadobacter fanqingshengii]MCF0040623.1 SDR family oxidoreductase [Dyadobacter fanqingshengii]USJ37639.1 SDR family oxidoreductase [Dyadobacter fanqingshengii]